MNLLMSFAQNFERRVAPTLAWVKLNAMCCGSVARNRSFSNGFSKQVSSLPSGLSQKTNSACALAAYGMCSPMAAATSSEVSSWTGTMPPTVQVRLRMMSSLRQATPSGKQCSITDLCLRSVVHLATDLATDPHCAIDMHGEPSVVLGRLIDQAKYCTTDPKRHDDGLGELRQRAVFI